MNAGGSAYPSWRRALLPLAAAYGWAVTLRNRRYDGDARLVTRVAVPVVSIGNVTAGGTGKTPMVIEFVRRLLARGRRPAILTRGYAARAGQTPDEVAEFHAALPGVPVVVNADRVAGANAAIAQHQADVLVLDDGFQHRRLARDLDVVLVDALDPWGGDALLPAGRLREPLAGLRRADLFIITRANQVEPGALARIDDELRDRQPAAGRACVAVRADRLVGRDERESPLAELAYDNVLPVCAIGNPDTFLRLVADHAGRCTRPLLFGDHHAYSPRDVQRILACAAAWQPDRVVVTRKDWSKLAPLWPTRGEASLNGQPEAAPPDLFRIEMKFEWMHGQAAIDAALDRVLSDERRP